MKIKNVTAQIKAGPADGLAEGSFTAYASVFGNVDRGGDRVLPGAFTKTLSDWAASGDPIPLLFGHNFADPDYNLGHIVSAAEDEHGLLVNGQLDLEGPKSLQVYRLLKGRRLRQLSYAYDVMDGGPAEDDDEVFELRELKLHEVSLVPLGMNDETEVLTVKHATDLLIGGAKAGRVLSEKNLTSLREARDAIGSVIKAAEQTENDDQGKASGTGSAKGEGASSVKPEEPRRSPSAESWATELSILELEGVPR